MVGNGHRRLGQAQSSTHIRHSSQNHIWQLSSSGTAARQEADCRTSTVTQAKAWNRWVLMPATCAATGICSIKPYLAQCAVLTTHHHGAWAVRRVSKLCPEEIKDVAWWRNGGMPSSQRHMGVRPWPELGAQRVWLSPGAPLASGSVTIATTLLLSRGLLASRHAVVSWEALARLPGSSLTRVFWTCPARESKAGPCSPRLPSGRSRAARPEPRRRVPREGPHEALIGRAAVPRGAAGGRTATAAVADHGRPEASRA